MDIKKIQRDIFSNTAKQARNLAAAIADNTLGPTDTGLCVDALNAYAAQVEAGFALVAPPVADQIDAGQA